MAKFKKVLFIFSLSITVSLILVLIFLIADYLLSQKLQHPYNYPQYLYNLTTYDWKKKSYLPLRKTVPNNTSDKIFMTAGCSFVYGDYLNENQTLASLMAKLNNEYHFVNTGLSAGSLHHFLYDYSTGKLDKYFKHKDTTITYGIYYDQIYRVHNKLSNCCPPWGPEYSTVNDNIIFEGFFIQNIYKKPLQSLYRYSAISNYIQMLYFNHDNMYLDTEIDKQQQLSYCKLLAHTYNISKTKSHKFYVYSYENFTNQNTLKKCLIKHNVPIISTTSIFNKSKFHINENNTHPNETYNSLLARELLEYLSKNKANIGKL